MTNGTISSLFDLTRGTRQGCSLFPLLFNIVLEPLAIAIRSNASIRGVEGEKKERKLLLYADDILMLIRNPLESLPHLMTTIQSYSKLSGYKVNWKKSEAMPISGTCHSSSVSFFNFKLVSNGMSYLGIKLCRTIETMPVLNSEPALQKVKDNLDKWGKLKLSLWGKISVIKMVVAPQLNYIARMLPVAIPPQIFKQYDSALKEFLWEGKKLRIGMSKMCSPKDRGGLGLPSLRLYHVSFDIAKLAKHWVKDNNLDWVSIESEMCSPFTTIDRLSQSQHGPMNPILSHSKGVWNRIHKMLKIPHLRQPYSSIWHNPTIVIGKTLIYWKKKMATQWYMSGR